MTAAEDRATPQPFPLASASPRQIRDALTPEDAESFERQWRRLMQNATESLDLSEVEDALRAWRMTAAVTATLGVDAYRDMLESAEHRLRTGERAPGAMSWDQLKVELGLAD